MKDNVKLLGSRGITPEYIVHHLQKNLSNIEEIFIVSYDSMKNPSIVFSGTIQGLKQAVFDLQRAAVAKADTAQGKFNL